MVNSLLSLLVLLYYKVYRRYSSKLNFAIVLYFLALIGKWYKK